MCAVALAVTVPSRRQTFLAHHTGARKCRPYLSCCDQGASGSSSTWSSRRFPRALGVADVFFVQVNALGWCYLESTHLW